MELYQAYLNDVSKEDEIFRGCKPDNIYLKAWQLYKQETGLRAQWVEGMVPLSKLNAAHWEAFKVLWNRMFTPTQST